MFLVLSSMYHSPINVLSGSLAGHDKRNVYSYKIEYTKGTMTRRNCQ
jgi:hypothetical protein